MSSDDDDELGLFSFANKKDIHDVSVPSLKDIVPGEQIQEAGETLEQYFKRDGKRKRTAPVAHKIEDNDENGADEDLELEEEPEIQKKFKIYDDIVSKLCTTEPVNDNDTPLKKKRMTKSVKKRNDLLNQLEGVIGMFKPSNSALDTSIEESNPDSGVLQSLPDRPILLKFKKGKNIHKFKVYKKTPLSVPLGHIASMYETEASQLILQLNDETLDSNKSSDQLGISVADIIDVLVVGEWEEEEPVGETSKLPMLQPGALTIKIQSKDHRNNTKEIIVFRDKKLEEYLFKVTKDFGYGAARFIFDGESVDPRKTPAELDIEDQDCIDIIDKTPK